MGKWEEINELEVEDPKDMVEFFFWRFVMDRNMGGPRCNYSILYTTIIY